MVSLTNQRGLHNMAITRNFMNSLDNYQLVKEINRLGTVKIFNPTQRSSAVHDKRILLKEYSDRLESGTLTPTF